MSSIGTQYPAIRIAKPVPMPMISAPTEVPSREPVLVPA